jgi:hypothetical protein
MEKKRKIVNFLDIPRCHGNRKNKTEHRVTELKFANYNRLRSNSKVEIKH